MKKLLLVLPLAALFAAGCDKHSSPVAPTSTNEPAATPQPAPEPTPHTIYPTSGPELIAFVGDRYPERLAGGISPGDRRANMEFLRDRIIEAGRCGGMDLGWNLKRGGPELSVDFLAWRHDGIDMGVDIGFDYDNTSVPLRLQWLEAGPGAAYKEYPLPSCE